MNFITVCVIVCAIALSFSFDFVNPLVQHKSTATNVGIPGCHSVSGKCMRSPHVPIGAEPIDTARVDPAVSMEEFESGLKRRYLETSATIVDAWRKCNETYHVPSNESYDMFINPTWGVERALSKDAKCLIDCTMRKMGVMTDEGFQWSEYIDQIKKLRFVYTTFNINDKPDETRMQMWNAVFRQALEYSYRKCYINANFDEGSDSLDRHYCYGLAMSYYQAVKVCKDIRHAEGDSCETSLMIMKCIISDNRRRSYDVPFYPAVYTISVFPQETLANGTEAATTLN
ncbi:uncharacterized protein LOC119074528 isoform X2 [Bradysia coprophila]|uniref:uncharacterized protein LOC119074528 isoform X2 n=1 Tax=Bradysia coprophila TaxID=38358 RepID=UPI00187DDA37|nr:uncharacterized protein LOC119074528 isoform X2 [Bradysia coprophila]